MSSPTESSSAFSFLDTISLTDFSQSLDSIIHSLISLSVISAAFFAFKITFLTSTDFSLMNPILFFNFITLFSAIFCSPFESGLFSSYSASSCVSLFLTSFSFFINALVASVFILLSSSTLKASFSSSSSSITVLTSSIKSSYLFLMSLICSLYSSLSATVTF